MIKLKLTKNTQFDHPSIWKQFFSLDKDDTVFGRNQPIEQMFNLVAREFDTFAPDIPDNQELPLFWHSDNPDKTYKIEDLAEWMMVVFAIMAIGIEYLKQQQPLEITIDPKELPPAVWPKLKYQLRRLKRLHKQPIIIKEI